MEAWDRDYAEDEWISERSRLLAAILAFFFGVFGAHRFYAGKIGTAVLQLCTLGGLGVWSFIDFIIILFGSPLATSSKRGGAAYGIGLALGSVLLYTSLMKVSEALGATGAITPFWAAWSPNLAFGAIGLILLARVRT